MIRISLAALIVLIAQCANAQQEQQPPTVTVASPVVKEIVEDDEFVGRYEATAEVEVRARVSGYLETVHFIDGALVERGDPLFTVDQRLFRTAVRQAEAQLQVAEASFDFNREQLDRAERLLTNGNISQSAVDERREAFLQAQAAIEDARAALEAAMIDLEFSEIHAPIGGRIGRDLVTPGNLVTADSTVMTTIVALDPMHFYFDIDERYFLAYARDARARGSVLQQGGGDLPVRVTLADGMVHEGRLDFSENRLDPQTGTMRVRAVVPNPDGVIQPGLFGRVNVPGSLPYDAVMVPDEAVMADQNRRVVMLVDDEGNVSPREVRPGPLIDGYRVIREGLTGDETVVIKGLMRARPGAVVTPDRVTLADSRE